jgi:hypothetical protein
MKRPLIIRPEAEFDLAGAYVGNVEDCISPTLCHRLSQFPDVKDLFPAHGSNIG